MANNAITHHPGVMGQLAKAGFDLSGEITIDINVQNKLCAIEQLGLCVVYNWDDVLQFRYGEE